jgi:8-oxo-dGTP pyrophosphatase MutT (NUDIX family)
MPLTRLRASVVCVDDGALLCVRIRDPLSGEVQLFPPGGGIEPAESPAEAALREAREETGYALSLVPGVDCVARYPFVWAGNPVDVTTHFFGARLVRGRDAQGAHEQDDVQLDVGWLPLVAVADALSFHATIRDAVLALVEPLERGGGEGAR